MQTTYNFIRYTYIGVHTYNPYSPFPYIWIYIYIYSNISPVNLTLTVGLILCLSHTHYNGLFPWMYSLTLKKLSYNYIGVHTYNPCKLLYLTPPLNLPKSKPKSKSKSNYDPNPNPVTLTLTQKIRLTVMHTDTHIIV